MIGRLVRLVGLAILVVCAVPASATVEYALETTKPCEACHRDPAGGGSLTAEGAAFQAQKAGTPAPAPMGAGLRAIRFIAGSLHLLTATLWFGTIFYVHLMLKPSYAVRGLPRGEVRIGRTSMVVMVVTGLILTYIRMPSLEALFVTRFGILLLVKVGLFLVMLATAMLAVHVLSPRLAEIARRAAAAGGGGAGKRDFTLEDLDQYDGRDGRRSYIAYKGVIYDVTLGGSWQNGLHVGRHQAGQDLSRDIALAPHNDERVLAMPVIGKLIASSRPKAVSLPERLFYAAAYLNLGLAVAIVLTVALWRWG
jgi:predicted heme/steroid binding protein